MDRKCVICGKNVKSNVQLWNIPSIEGVRNIGFGYCLDCEIVIQTPTIEPSDMYSYYKETATYINPGRNGKPSINKIKDVKRQIDFLHNNINMINIKNVFQIGCSDGYTLSQFKALGIDDVTGIDPSVDSHNLAYQLYGINTIVGVFENYTIKHQYDLLVMTHILEHVYEPKNTLEKCFDILKDDGYILLEIPLFENHLRFPIGMFTLEHLNYFTENGLKKLLALIGFEVISIEKLYFNNSYPVINLLLQKKQHNCAEIQLDFQVMFDDYIKTEQHLWKNIEKKITSVLTQNEDVYLWGAGLHTTQLLANTNIEKFVNIKGLLDSSVTKHKKNLGKYMINNPIKEIIENYTIIISSYASEKEIYKYIKENFSYKKIVLLYNKG